MLTPVQTTAVAFRSNLALNFFGNATSDPEEAHGKFFSGSSTLAVKDKIKGVERMKDKGRKN